MAIERSLSLDDSYSVCDLDRLVERYGGCVVEPLAASKSSPGLKMYHMLDATLKVKCIKSFCDVKVEGIYAYASDENKIRNIEGMINCDIRQIATSIH